MSSNIITREKVALEKKQFVKISNCCNNNCIFCLDADSQDNSFIPEKIVKKRIKEGIQSGAKRLIISGGEASINPNFINYIKFAKKLGYEKIQTITNGRMYSYFKFLKEAVESGLNEITFSIHGHNSQLNDRLTNVSGSFEQIIKALNNAKNFPNLIINIDIAINKKNLPYIYDIIQYFSRNFGIFEYDLLQIVPYGNAFKNRRNLFYSFTRSDLKHLKKVFNLAKNDQRFYIWTNRFPPQFLEDYEFLIQDPGKIYDEMSGRRFLFNKFLKFGKKPDCYNPERCPYCFLNDFCKKLTMFKQNLNKKIEFKIINSLSEVKNNQKIKYVLEIEKKNFKKVLTSSNIIINKDIYLALKNFNTLSKTIKYSLCLEDIKKKLNNKNFKFINIPFCLLDKNDKTIFYFYQYLPFVLEKQKVGLDKFINTYIKDLYYCKSIRCTQCKFNSKCEGLHINQIRINGFRVLKPLLNH